MRVMMEIHAHPIPAAAEIASILRIARVRIPTADALPVQTATARTAGIISARPTIAATEARNAPARSRSTEIIIAPETPALIR